MVFQDILYFKERGRARVLINRPERRNAIRTQTIREMTAALEDAEKDSAVGVVVLGSTSDAYFTVGGEINEMKDLTPAQGRLMFKEALRLSSTMRNLGKPIVAVIKGYCVGVGNHLNLFSDLTVAADNAKFSQASLRVATAPVWGGLQLLPKVVGDKRAREMIFLGRTYDAQQALAMGLCNFVVPLEEVEKTVEELCEELLQASPTALRIAKLGLNYAADSEYPSFVTFPEMMAMLYGTPELKEGMASFLEKRRPVYDPYR